ncbi:hypothetical protein [Streptomyces sp. 3211]|uniref:hypothetical protein n=1 Tax=Streptomyces sp. 3211 TaxID=1964449 RepID=UPI000D1A03A7|nr:hypothetical protein [Streptomyces sp. 3211]
MEIRKIPQERRRIVRAGMVLAVLAGLASAGWCVYAWQSAPIAGASRTGGVDAASRMAKAETERRLEGIVDVLPGAPRPLGVAAADHCLRSSSFEGESPGPLSCQWRLERFVVFDGDLRTVGDAWGKALSGDRWIGSHAPFPVGYSSTSERYAYSDPRTHDRLSITIIQDGRDLRLLHDANRFDFEGVEEYERERRDFTGRTAAERAVAQGQQVASVSLVRAYYSQSGNAPFEPMHW